MFRAGLLSLTVILSAGAVRAAEAAPLEFRLTFDSAALNAPFTGRVFVMLSKSSPGELPQSISWGQPEPVFAKDVVGWKPGEPLVINSTAMAFPTPMTEIAKGDWFVSAVMDRDQGDISFSAAPGNIYAKAARQTLA